MDFTSCTPIPPISPFLCTHPPKKNAIVEAAGWQADRPVKPFSPYIFTCRYSLQWVIGPVWGLSSATLSILVPYWGSSWMSCCCPVWWRACSFRAAGPSLSCALAGHRWCGCWDGPTLDLGGSWVGQPANSPASSPSGWVLHSAAWASSPSAPDRRGRGRFCSHTLMGRLALPPISGSGLLCCPGLVQGRLSWELQSVRGRASSPAWPAAGDKGWRLGKGGVEGLSFLCSSQLLFLKKV